MRERSYVIRVYQREHRPAPARRALDTIALVGVVEFPESGERSAFRDIEELWTILVRHSGRDEERKRQSGKRPG